MHHFKKFENSIRGRRDLLMLMTLLGRLTNTMRGYILYIYIYIVHDAAYIIIKDFCKGTISGKDLKGRPYKVITQTSY